MKRKLVLRDPGTGIGDIIKKYSKVLAIVRKYKAGRKNSRNNQVDARKAMAEIIKCTDRK